MALASSLFCSNCGSENPPQATYCNACGSALQAGTPSAPLPSPSSLLSTSTDVLPSGHILRERYRIQEEIGQGGFGAVYRAEDTRIADRVVAVKEVRQGNLNTQEMNETTEAFKQEAFLLARLKHANLPGIYDYFAEAGRWYVVMDFIEGETLEDYLAKGGKGRSPGTPLSPAEVLQIGIQLCSVLDYLHTRQPPIIFRDLKPANIMRTDDGQLYLIDFGIARIFKQGKASDTIALGSPGYAAPEQYGKSQSTPQSDIYGLGVTLHELLTGSDPSLSPFIFTAPVVPGYAELSDLIMQMVETNPENRPVSAAYVKQELQRIAEGRAPGLAERPLTPPPLAVPLTATSSSSSSLPPPYHSSGDMQRMRMFYQTPNQQSYQPYQKTYQPPLPPRRGISRRAMVAGLVGVIVGGSLISQWLSSHHNDYSGFGGFDHRHNMQPDMGPPNTNISPSGLAPTALLGLAWSPNGKYIATGAAGVSTVQVLDARTRAVLVTYTGHTDGISMLAWSPDSKRIASASYDATVQIWDAATGKSLMTLTSDHSPSAILSVAWSPDGSRLVSGSYDQTVKIWDATTGQTIDTDYGHHDQVTSVAWSPDGQYIASGSADNTVIVSQAQSLAPLYTYTGHSDVVQVVAWSPDSKHIASGSNDTTVQVWDATNGGNALTYSGHTDQVWAVAWSPNGTYIASGSFDQTLQVWLAANGNLLTKTTDNSKIVSVTWSPDGQTILSGDADGDIGQIRV